MVDEPKRSSSPEEREEEPTSQNGDRVVERLLDALDEAFTALEFLEEQTGVQESSQGVYEFPTERGPVLIFRPNPTTVTRVFLDGRPDGGSVGRFASWLDKVENLLRDYIAKEGTDVGFQLPEETWEALFREATQRYFRYLLLANLERWDRVEQDTAANLRVCELAHRYAEPETAWRVYQYKGYILMINTIARAEQALAAEDPEQARQTIEEGIQKIGAFCRECLLEGHEDAEQITREHYLSNLLRYQEDLSSSGRLENLGRADPRNVV